MQPDQPLPPPQQMMSLITGYWRTQAVGVAATLAIADRLGDGTKTVAALAAETKVHEIALYASRRERRNQRHEQRRAGVGRTGRLDSREL
jgi:hypothetical protein